MNLQNLITEAKNDNYRPLHRFFFNYYPRCLRSLMTKLKISETDAKDLFSEAKWKFIKRFVTENTTPPTTKKEAEGYIYRTAYNHYLDQKKKKANQIDDLDNYQIEQYLINKVVTEKEQAEIISEDHQKRIAAVLAAKKETGAECLELIEARRFKGDSLDEIYRRTSYKSKKVLKVRISQCWKKFVQLCNEKYVIA